MAGHWIVLYKQFIEKRKQIIRDELLKNKSSPTICKLVDELLRLESAVAVNRTDMFERVRCPNWRPETCKKTTVQNGKRRRKIRKLIQSYQVARWNKTSVRIIYFSGLSDITKKGNTKRRREWEKIKLLLKKYSNKKSFVVKTTMKTLVRLLVI